MSTELDVLASVEAPVSSALQNPVLHAAMRRIELAGLPINFQEDILHQVFGFPAVPQDAVSHAENQATVPIEENRQGVRLAASELPQEILVGHVSQVKRPHLEAPFINVNSLYGLLSNGASVQFMTYSWP
jgi:hypothetical protein